MLNGYKGSVCSDERFWKIIVTMDVHIVMVVNTTEFLTLKWQLFIILLNIEYSLGLSF